jgi:hypothetical protein
LSLSNRLALPLKRATGLVHDADKLMGDTYHMRGKATKINDRMAASRKTLTNYELIHSEILKTVSGSGKNSARISSEGNRII